MHRARNARPGAGDDVTFGRSGLVGDRVDVIRAGERLAATQ